MRKLLLILFLLMPLNLDAGIKSNFLIPISKFMTHHTTIGWLDYSSSHLFSYYNGSADAIFWGYYNENKKNKMYGVKPSRWHYYKNMAQLMLVIKGFTVGINIIRYINGEIELQQIIYRELFLLPAMKFTWDARYNHVRYNNAFHQKNYVIPAPGIDDIKIQLKGNQIDVANFIEISTGFIFGMTIYDKFWRF